MMRGLYYRKLQKLAFLLALTGIGAGFPVKGAIPIDTDVPTLAPVVDRVVNGVVNIAVSGSVEVQNPLLADPFFRQFFGFSGQPMRQEVQAAGSGVIVDAANGYVLTNNHVIAVGQSQVIEVTLKDTRHFRAKLVGVDPETDLAVLKIDADNLTAVPLGDSDKVRVGDYVLAVGNPFGLGQTVTSGIVSALGRSGLGIEKYEDFIQTDASINPGNSGGALVDLRGRLVGINTAIVGPAGGNVGIGFAVPANLAKTIMTDLIRDGQVKRGQINGAAWQDVTPEIAASLGLNTTEGALIARVADGSAAAKAGLTPGDVVTQIDGMPVRGVADIRKRLSLARVGDTLNMTITRDGKKVAAKIPVEAIPQSRRQPQPRYR